MYTIMVSDSNELVTTISERILRKSNLVDYLHFLVPPIYKNAVNMRNFSVRLDYILPISQDHFCVELELSHCLYKGMLEYRLPFGGNLTKEAGDVKVWLTFTREEVDKCGQKRTVCRRTTPTTIPIYACENNYDYGTMPYSAIATNREVDEAFDRLLQKFGQCGCEENSEEENDDGEELEGYPVWLDKADNTGLDDNMVYTDEQEPEGDVIEI